MPYARWFSGECVVSTGHFESIFAEEMCAGFEVELRGAEVEDARGEEAVLEGPGVLRKGFFAHDHVVAGVEGWFFGESGGIECSGTVVVRVLEEVVSGYIA